MPEFLRLFHSTDASPGQSPLERVWILRVLRDGMRDGLDYAVMQKEHVGKMIMAFHDSVDFAWQMRDQDDEGEGKGEDREVQSIIR